MAAAQRDAVARARLADFVTNVLQALIAFSMQLRGPIAACHDPFGDCIELSVTLMKECQSVPVRRAVLLLLRRTLECLQEATIPYIAPVFCGVMLTAEEGLPFTPEDVCELLRFFSHLCARFAREVPRLIHTLIKPLLTLVFNTLQTSTTPQSDEERSIYHVRQAYGTFVQKLVDEKLSRAILTEDNRSLARPLVQSLVSGIAISDVEPRNYQHAKICARVILVLVKDWWSELSELQAFTFGTLVPALFKFLFDPRFIEDDGVANQLLLDFARLFQFFVAISVDNLGRALSQLSLPSGFIAKLQQLARTDPDNLQAQKDIRELLKALILRRRQQTTS